MQGLRVIGINSEAIAGISLQSVSWVQQVLRELQQVESQLQVQRLGQEQNPVIVDLSSKQQLKALFRARNSKQRSTAIIKW